MAIIGLFQCDPTQNWLKNATNDISIQEFHNVTGVYLIAIINKTPLRNENCPITDPIAEMGVAHTVWPCRFHENSDFYKLLVW